MKLSVIAFTSRGLRLAERLPGLLSADNMQIRLRACFGGASVSAAAWTKEAFSSSDALLFIGAAGIAVRCIAPLLRSKLTDPAVLVMDEGGRFCISLLSGHAGGANRLAERIAALCGAEPVVTTATDGRGLFAVDEWASRFGCALLPKDAIRLVSGALLEGKPVGLSSDFPIAGELPRGFVPDPPEGAPRVRVTCRAGEDDPLCLRVVPRAATLGIGCRRGISEEAIAAAVDEFLSLHHWEKASIREVCSIDLKRDEEGLLAFCRTLGVPARFFPADTLAQAQGNFSTSEFVSSVTGVGNVCERAAVCGGGTLELPKFVREGVTAALAVDVPPLTFQDWRE